MDTRIEISEEIRGAIKTAIAEKFGTAQKFAEAVGVSNTVPANWLGGATKSINGRIWIEKVRPVLAPWLPGRAESSPATPEASGSPAPIPTRQLPPDALLKAASLIHEAFGILGRSALRIARQEIEKADATPEVQDGGKAFFAVEKKLASDCVIGIELNEVDGHIIATTRIKGPGINNRTILGENYTDKRKAIAAAAETIISALETQRGFSPSREQSELRTKMREAAKTIIEEHGEKA